MTAPTWLLRTTGGVTRTTRLQVCTRCHVTILTGLDADYAALTARADPTPLDRLGEVLALAAGRPTYDLAPRGGQKRQLDYRDEYRISGHRRYPVLPAHKCGQPLPAAETPTPARKEVPGNGIPF